MEYLPLLSIIIAVSSFLISLFTYWRFHAREIEKKQIELVLALIKDIHNHFVDLHFIKTENNNTSMAYKSGTIFSIVNERNLENEDKVTTWESFSLENSDFYELPIYVPENHSKIFEIGQELANPLLPQKIAEALNKIVRTHLVFSKKDELRGKYFLLLESKILDSKERRENFPLMQYELVCSNFPNYGEFVNGVNQLKDEVQKWLKKQGLKDLNIYWKEPRHY